MRGEWGVVRDGAGRGSASHRRVPLPTPHDLFPSRHLSLSPKPIADGNRAHPFRVARSRHVSRVVNEMHPTVSGEPQGAPVPVRAQGEPHGALDHAGKQGASDTKWV